MTTRRARAGFTLIELLVVVAIIALLLAILMPSLAGAREQAKRAKCLANLNSVAKATQQYAMEDKKDLVIPIHYKMLEPAGGYFGWRTVNWFTWGGPSASKVFKTNAVGGWMLREPETGETAPPASVFKPEWDAKRRPLNRYIFGGDINQKDKRSIEWFRCPSDTGYPDHPLIDDSPSGNALRSCYETMGNSYRGSLYALFQASSGGDWSGAMAIGPWGHRLSTIFNAARTIAFGEPTFFNMIGSDDTDVTERDPILLAGWHKKNMIDNLIFCDGSARSTRADKILQVDAAAATAMNAMQAYISRGPTWTLDCYPTPGARIWGNWSSSTQNMWPFLGMQTNLR